MPFAVIDLGTNTFHLLIAEKAPEGGWTSLLRQRFFVKLAENGISRIGDAAFARGLAAMEAFKVQLDLFDLPAERVRAFGTAALRTAENAPAFLQEVLTRTGIRAEAISGDREAMLIYKGVRQAVPFPEGTALLMDIGGGSTEFILADRQQVFWQKSFPVGVSVLFQEFHRQDPIAAHEIAAMESFLAATLQDLWRALEQFPARALLGAAGAFDVIDNFLLDAAQKPPLYGRTDAVAFLPLYERFVRSTLNERRAMPQLAPERMEMIVAGVILIRQVLQKAGMRDIYTSVYSLKEGMLAELFENR